MITADQALQRLKEGNRRFISGTGGRDLDFEHSRRRDLVHDQKPFAVVLGCSDSRVPLELIFDQGLGDLFVIRVAGNVAGPTQLGSIEFAATAFHTPLLVVLGHSKCGAVAATLQEVRNPTGSVSQNLAEVTDRIRPAVSGLLSADSSDDQDLLLDAAVEANVRNVVAGIAEDSDCLAARLTDGRLRVIGAQYSLETGSVTFFSA